MGVTSATLVALLAGAGFVTTGCSGSGHWPREVRCAPVATTHDRAVIEAVARHMISHPAAFDIADPERTDVVLDGVVPRPSIALLGHAPLTGEPLPDWARLALERRNSSCGGRRNWRHVCNPCAKPVLVVRDFERRLFDSTPKELGEIRSVAVAWFPTFHKAFPTARLWVQASLPGYSEDGDQAVVRAFSGPSAHGSLVTALLRLRSGQWEVESLTVDHFS